MKKRSLLFLFLNLILIGGSSLSIMTAGMIVGGCSGTSSAPAGASAPPVSLPAPIVGRLTITSPDENGFATVIGDTGAVPDGALVHAVNGTQDPTSASTLKIGMDSALVKSQTLPPTCETNFHACATAATDGSFEMLIQAESDESVVIGILDPTTGTRISERTQTIVPKNLKRFPRPIRSLSVFNGSGASDHKVYSLMGSTVSDPKGLIGITDTTTGNRTTMAWTGSSPDKITVKSSTREAAVIDSAGGFIAKVDLSIDNFNIPDSQVSVSQPTNLALNTLQDAVLVTTAETAGNASLIRVFDFPSLLETGQLKNSDLQVILPGAANARINAIAVREITAGPVFDGFAFVGTVNVGGTATPILGLGENQTPSLTHIFTLPSGTDPVDIVFTSENNVLIVDAGNHLIQSYNINIVFPGFGLSTVVFDKNIADPSGLVVSPRNIVLNASQAFVTVKNGNDSHPDSVLTIDLATTSVVDMNSVGFGPTGLSFDPNTENLFVSAAKSQTLATLGLTTLQP